LSIEATPSQIHPLLTKKLQLRCAVKNAGRLAETHNRSAKSSEVALSLISDLSGLANPNPSSLRHVSSDASFSKLLSIVVTRVNDVTGMTETVTSVTGCNVPKTEEKFNSTLEVEGSSEGSDREDELGYLLLTWDRPVDGHAGNFTCETNALNSDKHPVYLNVSLEITSGEPKIADLAKYIYAREKEILYLQSEMKKENVALRQEIVQLLSNTAHLETKLQRLKAQNIQTGNFSCTEETGRLIFPKSYTATPTVFVSITGLEFQSHFYRSSVQYQALVQEVNSDGFSYTCEKYDTVPTIKWLAIDS
ncbi:unnamed protein product, partial [Lymnaea stagnalis]